MSFERQKNPLSVSATEVWRPLMLCKSCTLVPSQTEADLEMQTKARLDAPMGEITHHALSLKSLQSCPGWLHPSAQNIGIYPQVSTQDRNNPRWPSGSSLLIWDSNHHCTELWFVNPLLGRVEAELRITWVRCICSGVCSSEVRASAFFRSESKNRMSQDKASHRCRTEVGVEIGGALAENVSGSASLFFHPRLGPAC